MQACLDLARVLVSENRELLLPKEIFRLEEANLPTDLALSLAGKTVEVRIEPAEAAGTRHVERDDHPQLIYPDGSCWNDWRPLRAFFTDKDGHQWRFPRRWLPDWPVSSEASLAGFEDVANQFVFRETMNPPNEWDLWEINVPWGEVRPAYRRGAHVFEIEVHLSPREPAKVFWRSQKGALWRVPHDWRRRRVKLPEARVLVAQGIPDDVAEGYADKIVSVNYHPGSLCCLPEQYRFRDEAGNRWPVQIRDCILVGLGDAAEHVA